MTPPFIDTLNRRRKAITSCFLTAAAVFCFFSVIQTAHANPKVIRSHDFTFPAHTKAQYPYGIKNYLAKNPLAPSQKNKQALINEHLRLAQNHYSTHIARSKVRIFDRDAITDKRVFDTRLRYIQSRGTFVGKHPNGPGKSYFGNYKHNVQYHLNAKPYTYKQDEAYVDFAAKKIMGGALGHGFVQEEIQMLTSNFLPIGASVRSHNRRGARFARKISLKNLDTHPVVFKSRQFMKLEKQGQIYGRKLETVSPFNAGDYLKVLPKPVDIYSTAIAAKSYRAGSHYSPRDIEQMIALATKGFYNTMLAQYSDNKPISIHTGNWGAGAFNNSPKTMWAIQRVAIEAAHNLFITKTKVKSSRVTFSYDAYDLNGAAAAMDAHRFFAKKMSKVMTSKQVAQKIFAQTRTDRSWDIK